MESTKNSKAKSIIMKILIPSVRDLYFALLIFWSLITIYAAFLFTLEGKALEIFISVWYIVPILFLIYLLYGYGRILFLKIREAKRSDGFFHKIKSDKQFRSIFTSAVGIIINFAFATLYCIKGFMNGSGFYWFLAEFYLVAAMLNFYLKTISETKYSKNDSVAYIIIYCVSVLLAIAIAGVTFYVVVFDGIFEKNGYLVAFIFLFTVYKICSAIYSFHKARKNESRLNLAKSLIELSTSFFSVFTLCVALMIMITKNPLMKHFSYLGFGFAIVIFAMSIIGLVNSCREYIQTKKEVKQSEIHSDSQLESEA